ncbi:uncharacterized protein LOC142786329, partial [Rhipicephalus microplus]|uniref:uncharacterized protein LOC142786329 n=1 Tax=Rhipicephalus microplus TaxID=6941 RepID=UPI003F6BB324
MYPYTSDQTPEMYTSAYLPENTTQMMLTSDESTSLASDGSKDDVMRDTSRFTAVVLGVIIALGVLVLAMTVIMLSSGSKFHEKTFGTETQPGITENWRYTAIGATGTTPQPWFKSTVTSLTSQLTTTTTKESYGHLTKEPFTSTEKSIITVSLSTARTPEQGRLVSLLCTMGDKLGAPHMLPEDGPCDYLFYDSLFKKGFVLNGTLDSSMGLFINHHWWVKKAVTGTGLAYKYTKELFNWLDEDSTALPYLLNIFLKFRIRNYGCLDTASNGYDGLVMKQMLLILK